jgi:hypothetical protein
MTGAASFRRVLGSRHTWYSERSNYLFRNLGRLKLCVVNLDVLLGIEKVTVGVEPVLGIMFEKQRARVLKVAFGRFSATRSGVSLRRRRSSCVAASST